MKKIMFNDRYGLTEAVLQGRKTMTRRLVPKVGGVNDINWGVDNNGKIMITIEATSWDGLITKDIYPQYQVGEMVAIAQSYRHIYCVEPHKRLTEKFSSWFLKIEGLPETKGWNNKMFVEAEYMPHHIRITDIKVERLQVLKIKEL